MKKKELTEEDFLNWWLEKYHNTNLDEVKKLHPQWNKHPEKHTRDFYKAYQVAQEQHDEWEEWAIKTLMKEKKMPRKFIERNWWSVYLNTAPAIKQPKKKKV